MQKVTNISFHDYLDIFYKQYVLNNCAYRTQRNYESLIRVHIKPRLGMYKLNNLTTSTLQNFMISKYKEGYSRGYLDSIIDVIKVSLKHAVYPLELIHASPAQYLDVSKLKYDDNDIGDVILTREDMYKVFDFVRDIRPMHEIFYKILYLTGMRLSEVSGLTWDNIDLDKRIIKVRQQMQFQTGKGHILVPLKTRSSKRDIHFGDTLYEELANQRNKLNDMGIHSDYVCSKYNGSAIYKEDIEKVNRLINRDLLRFKTHSVRKLHATMLIEAGAEIKDVSARLGHSNTRITYDIYVKNTNRLRDKTVSIFESVL